MNDNLNNTKCLYCLLDPLSHSFRLKSHTTNTYETKIQYAKLYNHPKSIIHHIETYIDKNTASWEWYIDFNNAERKHYMAFNTLYGLCKWINREKNGACKNLHTITVLNAIPILIRPLIYISSLFLPAHIKVVEK